jgi:NADH-quinone oxidoreductase subunit A
MLFSVYHYDYFLLCSVFLIALILSIILFLISFIFIFKNYDIEKISIYECGFDPFENSLGRFDVRFYLVSILFLIFDIEVVFLFPWVLSLSSIGYLGFMVMYIFLILLTLGFLYEWFRGALEWS